MQIIRPISPSEKIKRACATRAMLMMRHHHQQREMCFSLSLVFCAVLISVAVYTANDRKGVCSKREMETPHDVGFVEMLLYLVCVCNGK
jgi:hypothetical protein